MSFEIAIVGHGRYPEGVVSALKLLAGTTDHLTAFNLDEATTHEAFTAAIDQFLSAHDQVLVFADMTGGAPHQITARLIMDKKKPMQYIVSSAPVNLVLDLYAQCGAGMLTEENVDEVLKRSVGEAKSLVQILPLHDPTIEALSVQSSAPMDDEGGI